MPELPEVETIRRDIEPHVAGDKIVKLIITEPRMVRRSPSAQAITDSAEGLIIRNLQRRGKFLLFMLSEAEPDQGVAPGYTAGPALVLHLGMSGQIIWLAAGLPLAPLARDDRHVHLRMHLSSGGLLLLRDPRMFGEVFFTQDFENAVQLGYEPLSQEFTAEILSSALNSRAPLKSALLDQRRIAGIGNIYADEALFLARLHPLRQASSLCEAEAGQLHKAIQDVLSDAILHRGSTIGDYRDAYGASGSMQSRHRVYGHTGSCPRCSTQIEKIKVAGRSTYFCPVCQPDKKISP